MTGMAQEVPSLRGKAPTCVAFGASPSRPSTRNSPQLNVDTSSVFPSASNRGSALRTPLGPGSVTWPRSVRSESRNSCSVRDGSKKSFSMSVDVVTMRSIAGMMAALYTRSPESAAGVSAEAERTRAPRGVTSTNPPARMCSLV
jgi:hypothetical protein